MKAGKTEVTFFYDDPPFATKATAMLVPVGKRGDEESRGADLYSRRGQLGSNVLTFNRTSTIK